MCIGARQHRSRKSPASQWNVGARLEQHGKSQTTQTKGGGGLEAGGVNSGIHSPAAQNEGSGAKRKALGPAAQQLPSPRSPMAAHPIEAHQGNYGAGGDLTSPAPALQRLSKHPRRPTPDPHPQSDCVSSQKPSRQSRERA